MPELCRFEGIIITMYFNDHSPPHFHAEYNGIETLLVLAWYELHKEELLSMWDTKSFKKIRPLA